MMGEWQNAQAEKWAALYVRLSRDDENEGDSNSIAHQIEILSKYARDRGITNFKIYKDDGYSGTNFNRPGFQEMLTDIEAGRVSTVIVKDMSRFGRNYLEVGMYTEIRFPELDVRFIAINDGVDTDSAADNDFTPFRNIINEWYAKDTSKKIRSYMKSKGESGKRLTTIPIYGFTQTSDTDKNWIIDPDAAEVVYRIGIDILNGYGPTQVATRLERAGILTPTAYFESKGMSYRVGSMKQPCQWSESMVSNIMDHYLEYLGHTVNFRTHRKSYKTKKTVENPPESIRQKLMELALELHTVNGKKQYGYLKKPLKDMVDSIVDELENLPEVAAYYSVWNDLRDTLEGYYKNRPRQHNPLSQQKEFRAIKNAIIQEAERLRQQMEQESSQGEEPSAEETSRDASTNPTLANENTSSVASRPTQFPSEYLLNSTIRLFHQMGQIFRDNAAPPSNPMGIRIDSKRRKKLMQKRLAMGHKQDDHEQNYDQTLQ